MPQYNTELVRSFKKIVTAGWAMHSNGDVESPTGHFAYIPISANELNELVDACLDDDDECPVESQYYVLVEDSDGNGALYIYGSVREALEHFNELTRQYEDWLGDDEDVEWAFACQECGEEFDAVEPAMMHEKDDSTESDCSDSLYSVVAK